MRALLLRYGVALLAAALLLTLVDERALFSTLGEAEAPLVAAAVLMHAAFLIVNSWKWKILLKPVGTDASASRLVRWNFAAMLYGLVLPGQVAGDAVRALRLHKGGEGNPSGSSAAASVTMDRVVGMAGVVVLGALASVAGHAPLPVLVAFSTMLAGALGATALFLLLLGPLGGGKTRLHTLLRRKSVGALVSLVRELRAYRSYPGSIATAFAISLFVQAITGVAVWCVFAAFGLDVPLLAALWISSFIVVVQYLPVSVAGIGTRDAALLYSLSLFGGSTEQVFGASVALFGCLVVLGLIGLLVELLPERQVPQRAVERKE